MVFLINPMKDHNKLLAIQPMLYFSGIFTVRKEVSVEQHDDPLLTLISRIKAGEEAAMEALYNATVNRVYGLALKIVSRPELAEEVVGDVFMQVWRNAVKFDPNRAVPLAWLLMICRSRSLDKLRREKSATRNQFQEEEQEQFEDTASSSSLDDIGDLEDAHKLTKALDHLNAKQRQIIALAFYRGMSHQEISNYTGDPLGTVKSNLRRAQGMLRTLMVREDYNPDLLALETNNPNNNPENSNKEKIDGGLYGKK